MHSFGLQFNHVCLDQTVYYNATYSLFKILKIYPVSSHTNTIFVTMGLTVCYVCNHIMDTTHLCCNFFLLMQYIKKLCNINFNIICFFNVFKHTINIFFAKQRSIKSGLLIISWCNVSSTTRFIHFGFNI